MKCTLVSLLFILAVSACNESAQTEKQANSDRFPGFTQVGQEGDSAKLYIDLNTVKRKENLVHLKLVRVLDAGYVIQDAITDCNGSFKALEGVQYRDDGTSDKKYLGDEQPLPFASKPDIAALVKKACDKAGVAQQVATPAAEKPTSGDKNKTAESDLPEETPNKLKTRAGLLEIARSDFNSPPDSLALNGKVVFKEENYYLSLYRVFSFADHDAVLFASNCGGTACQTNDFAFLVVKQGAESTVIKADDFYAYPNAVKTTQDGNTVKLALGFSGGKRKQATLDGEQLTIRLDDVPPQPLEEEHCKWLHTDAMPACVEGRTANPDCSEPQGDFSGAVMRGVAAVADYPGFVHSGFDQQCQMACQQGQAADYTSFGSAVCSKPKLPEAAATSSAPAVNSADPLKGCENLMNTAGQALECIKGNLQVEKDRLNAAYKTLFDALPVEKQAQLEAEQKAWLAKRDGECGKLTDETPASDAVGIAKCVFNAVTKRADELAKIPIPAASAAKNDGLPRVKEGDDYANVRKALLADGWQPYHSPSADTCRDGDTRCQGRPEMEACAGTGMANCNFLWKKDGKTIAVHTIGEGEPGVTGVSLIQSETTPSANNQAEWYTSTAKPVLVVRSIPDVTGEKIGTVPEGGKVKVLEKNVKPDSISGRSGSWVKIEWQGGDGYVFDGFLAHIL
jgi:uncharacterized protein YecT (DUF1311 family)